MGYGFSKVQPHDVGNSLGGFRLLLPVMAWRKRSYDINADLFRTGWWWFSLALYVESLGTKAFGTMRANQYGASLRLCWGWNWASSLNPKDETATA
jgi:hypothetical protein